MQTTPWLRFSGTRALSDIKAIVKHARWATSPEITLAAETMVARLKKIRALRDAAVIQLPGDGKTFFGGWVAPKCWDVKAATLKLVQGNGREAVLADFKKEPLSLMMWSPPTPRKGLVGEVVIVKDIRTHRTPVKGKFVLIDNLPQISIEHVDWAARRGAVGLVTDYVIPAKGVKEGPHLDRTCQYRNYTNPQWDGSRRLPAFGLRPEKGRLIRELLAQGKRPRLRAQVDARLFDGNMPLVAARLPGKSGAEIVLTAHMDEPGAEDNASGSAACMEILRALAEHAAALGRPLKRSVRMLASLEVRGIQALLGVQPRQRQVIAGLDLDMIGVDPRVGRSPLSLLAARPATPSLLEFVLEELVADEAKRAPRFRWKFSRTVIVNDCHFSGPPFYAPMCALEQCPNPTYHTALDVPADISARHLQRIGRLATRAVLFFADAEPAEIESMAQRVFGRARRDLRDRRLPGRGALEAARRRFGELTHLLPENLPAPLPEELVQLRQRNAFFDGYLGPRPALDQKIAGWMAQLNELAAKRKDKPTRRAKVSPPVLRTAARLVPAKTFIGYVGWEDLNNAARAKLKQTGLDAGWGPPGWLQWALDLSNGKRTLAEIYQTLQSDGEIVPLKRLIAAVRFLHAHKKIRFRPVLGQRELLAALRKAGVREGDVLMAHTSLSDFGYFERDAETVIEGLLAAVGPTGTVCVPTHSLSWIGEQPYDPQHSPSTVGAITNVFMKRPDAIRSLHPTHSVAAIGPLARSLVAGHDHTVAPMARNGFWGHFFDAGGKVLMMCKLTSNTLLHCGELWGGVPFPPCVCHIWQDGRRVEMVVPNMPWHVNSFAKVHESLAQRGLLRRVKLGESIISLMPAKEAVETQLEQIRGNPLLALGNKCDCRWCRAVKAKLPVVVGAPQTVGVTV